MKTYRLLEPGEVTQEGDLTRERTPAEFGVPVESHWIIWRPVPTWPTPIAIRERKPTAADADSMGGVLFLFQNGPTDTRHWQQHGLATHWLPLAGVEIPKPDPDEVAFEEWWKEELSKPKCTTTAQIARAAFLAGRKGGAK